ncbi:MAG TPA: FtsX-like permease family protein [Vicinamibacterales bacterium]|nr:FtsX-like permease family protein [Vicinamibacterales bacterium]
MRAFRLAWISVVRQPARSGLGILGVAAVGALLFDMLLLSHGLVLSFRDLLNEGGFDARVLATDMVPFDGPRLAHASRLAAQIAALPEVAAVQQVRVVDAELAGASDPSGHEGLTHTAGMSGRDGATHDDRVQFVGNDMRVRPLWTVVEGRDVESAAAEPTVVVNRRLARALGASPGSRVALRGRCGDAADALPPVTFVVSGIADFPFDAATDNSAGGTIESAARLCGGEDVDRADMLLVRSRDEAGPGAAVAAIRRLRPDLHVVTNEQMVAQFSRVEFSYFREISSVLATVTLFFGFLLIAVLLTVSVNQHLGEIATLRAVGLSRGRVVSGILWESVLLVGTGGILAVPVGLVLSVWLDRILRGMPGIPSGLHFFVFEPRALGLYAVLLAVASIGAAAYPMRIVAALPIAGTLRREVVS